MAEQRVRAQPRGGSLGTFPARRVPCPCPPGVGGSEFRWAGGATWTLCSPCCEFPPTPRPPPFSLWPWAEQAFLILGLVGWFQGSWLQGAEGGESGGLRCLGSRAQSSVLTLRSLVFSMCLQLEGSWLSSHGTSPPCRLAASGRVGEGRAEGGLRKNRPFS